ncbi:transcriptional regulatory protein GAL4 [Penicillium maclennaniae]|uniref:transcriptional regulatory protein GAL4 n=1 Tax=Penicillium maclennaniae TaxID=1343394 RepID=UPI002540FFA0|nr:transcriptional regulatory protein GAL4 [Penicillium maclennaniae]KAJ5677468.1 transcriptional regulatory protein GAL4 [Penicillium maclennaniae]
MSAPSKRRRAVLACNSCRHRKSRCDGGRPCAQCKELGCECLYQNVGPSCNLTVEKSYLARLEHRLQEVEASLRRLENNQRNGLSSGSSEPVQASDARNHNHILNDAVSLLTPPKSEVPTRANNFTHDRAEYGEIDVSEHPIDGMGAINFTDEEDCGFFGPSSNIAFLRHISRAIARGNAHTPAVPSLSSPGQTGGGMLNVSRSRPSEDSRSREQALSKNEVNIFALPSEDRTWSLIQIYFEKTGQLLPFIHEASFCETYFRMRADNFKRVRRTWLGLLNIVLAISTSLHTEGDLPAGRRIEESDVYYQRANGLCDRDSKRNATLEMVQYLLVLGQYLQGTQKSVQAWTTHGLAISAAFQLGLHSPEANRRFSPLDSEIRKRTWYGCILLDRTLSMTFGRPCTIPESYVKLELPLQDMQVLSSTPKKETCQHLDGWFFTAAIKLYVVMFNVLDTCYCQNLGFEHPLTTANAISQILDGERQLEEWRFQIVPALGIRLWHEPLLADDLAQMDHESTIRHRFGIVLSVRYHNLRILLYRKFLEGYLDSYGINESTSQDNKLIQQMGFTGVQNCIESAQSIISTVHTITSSTGWRRGLLGAWNYSLYYTFNAGLVIFGALLVASKERLNYPEQWSSVELYRPYLDLAADALRRLDSGNPVIERCVEYLSQLSMILKAAKNAALSEPLNLQIGPALQAPMSSTEFASPQPANHPMWSNMDLGEFMMDNDLDLLGRMFNFNQAHDAGI